MRRLFYLLLIAWVTIAMSGSAEAATINIVASQGKAIQYKYSDAAPGSWVSEERLKTRTAGTWEGGDLDANKSYVQFDLSAVKGTITGATLTIYAISGGKSYNVSGLNDGVDETWSAGTIDWFSAPGNDTTSGTALNASQTVSLYSVSPTVADGASSGDVTAFVNTDTDGLVTFILTAGQTAYLYNIIEGSYYNADYVPVLTLEGDFVGGPCEGVGISYSEYAIQSCRTELFDGTNPRVNDNRADGNKLSVRGDAKANKSWIKFDLSELNLDPNNLKTATLRITLYEPKSNTCKLSAVNDNYTTNIDWTDSTLTWNNAPGNITSSDGVNPNDDVTYTVDDLQDNLDPTKTTFVDTVTYTDGTAGQQYFFDVLPILQADTDGIVQFVLHGAGGYTNFATHDSTAGEAYWPRLDILVAPAGADEPYPCPGAVVSTDLAKLSWTNPDPNDGVSPITCTVYLGTDPNRPQMDSVTLSPDAYAVLINTSNFPNFGNLQNQKTYYWTVDCDDPGAGLIPGLMWDFYVNNNSAPVVNAGPDQAVWLGKSGTPGQEVVYLDGTTSDDGLPLDPGAYTVQWTQEDNGAPAVTISPDNVDDTSVTITERGDYAFTLTADDGQAQTSDTVRIVVGDDPCDASHIKTAAAYDPGDVNLDCIVNMEDFAELIAANWLDCSDTLMNCGN